MKKVIKLISLFLFFLTITLVINTNILKNHKREILNNNINIIASIVENHPDLEDDIIKSLLIKGDINKSIAILGDYGIEVISDLDYINENKDMRLAVYMPNMLLLTIVFLGTTSIYILNKRNDDNKIEAINRYMNDVLNGNYGIDIRDYKEGNLSILKNDIYKLVTRLKEMLDSTNDEKYYLESTLSDISHQLKTPLTSMYVINDILSNQKIKNEIKEEFLIKNKNQLERIEWLISSLLKMSMIDSGTIHLKQEAISVSDLVNSALEPLTIPIELKNQEVIIIGNDKTISNLDYKWTVEALINILKNAHEHSVDGGKIYIEYDDNPIYLSIKIKDSGHGICKKDLLHIYERFYKSNNSSKDSIGIGLNMAKKIIEKQNGEIRVINTDESGTTFEIKFYKMII